MCWSVPWPGAVEDEGLTRVPSAVCDCAHGGRVVKEASIAGLFKSRAISGSDVAHKSIFLRKRGVGSRERDALMHMATAELNSGLWIKPESIIKFCAFFVHVVHVILSQFHKYIRSKTRCSLILL